MNTQRVDLKSTSDYEPIKLSVMLPVPLAKSVYDYLPPLSGEIPAIGSYVKVPFAGRELIGVVWDNNSTRQGGASKADEKKLSASQYKHIHESLNLPPLTLAQRQFIEQMADYILAPTGMVLKMTIGLKDLFKEPAKQKLLFQANLNEAEGIKPLTPKREKIWQYLGFMPGLTKRDLIKETGASMALLASMIKDGQLQEQAHSVHQVKHESQEKPSYHYKKTELNEQQRHIVDRLSPKDNFHIGLIDGVTGSGKTEVYFDITAQKIEKGEQVLIMLPEIALSTNFVERFSKRFGDAPCVWHSDIGLKDRRETWQSVAMGQAKIVIGARSSLFLPFQNLGLIVVDEEHDPSYKQSEGICYQGRDMAILRAKHEDCPCLLISATPSLETLVNVKKGRFTHYHLPHRYGGAQLPEFKIIDMKEEALNGQDYISPTLAKALDDRLKKQEQSLLFLNRRGFAPWTTCQNCQFEFPCHFCSTRLVKHKANVRANQDYLECHQCGYACTFPKTCPHCKEAGCISSAGIGIERLADEIRGKLPHARIALASAETLNGPIACADFVEDINQNKVDIIIGTQIIAKGYHFPNITLVGIVDADMGLHGDDLRARERCYQLLSQVAGRAGRGKKDGLALVQSYKSDDPLLEAIIEQDRDGFMAMEEEMRKAQDWPPFSRLALIQISDESQNIADDIAQKLNQAKPDLTDMGDDVMIFGPAKPYLEKLHNRHRRSFLVKAKKTVKLQQLIANWLARVKPARSTKIRTDIDPYHFL